MKPLFVDECMDARLDDWAFWVTRRGMVVGRARSAEGHYRPERVADEEQRQARRVVDEVDALMIERALTSTDFPVMARQLLVGWYVLHANRKQICRKLGVPASQCEERMGWAARILENRLDKLKRLATMRNNNPTSTVTVSIPSQMAGVRMESPKACHV